MTLVPIVVALAGGPPPPFWLFPVLFIGTWFLVAFMISRVGGWTTLAEHYRSDQPFSGTLIRFQAAQLRYGTNYNGCLNFGVNSESLYMAPMAFFRMFHSPLLVPWSEITARPIKLWGIFNFVELRFQRAPEIPVRIRVSLAEKFGLASNGRFTHRLAMPVGI